MRRLIVVAAMSIAAISTIGLAQDCSCACIDCAADPVFIQRDYRILDIPRRMQKEPSNVEGKPLSESIAPAKHLAVFEQLETADRLARQPDHVRDAYKSYALALDGATEMRDERLWSNVLESYVNTVSAGDGAVAVTKLLLAEAHKAQRESSDSRAVRLLERVRNSSQETEPAYREATLILAQIYGRRGEQGRIAAEYFKLRDQGKIHSLPFEAKIWLAEQLQIEPPQTAPSDYAKFCVRRRPPSKELGIP